MSGWQLGLALFGCLLAGAVLGVAAVGVYARHVWKQKVGQLLGAATAATAGPKPGGYLEGVEGKAREGGGLPGGE